MVKRLNEFIPAKVQEYREPFCGGAALFFYLKNNRPDIQKWRLNDKFKDLVAFWQSVRIAKVNDLLRADLWDIKRQNPTVEDLKKLFLEMKDKEFENDYQRALWFYFFNRVSFSGTTMAGGFSAESGLNRFTASSIERLKPLPDFLKDVAINCRDYTFEINMAGKDVFIYLDPPYFHTKKLYGKNGELHKFNHALLAERLKECPHKWMVTYDDCYEARTFYQFANINEMRVQYGTNCSESFGGTAKVGDELIITNY